MYYAVSGTNAMGVYDNPRRIIGVKDYISKLKVVKCETMSQAYCTARDNYNSFQEYGTVDEIVDWSSTDISLNRVYFKKEICEINQRENTPMHC